MNPYGTPVEGALQFVDVRDPYPSPDKMKMKGMKAEVMKSNPWDFQVKSIALWAKEIDVVEQVLVTCGITDRSIDEIALLFPNEAASNHWIMDAILVDGVEHFNASWDRVRTQPFENEYRVRYDFLRFEGYDFRVEAMRLPYEEVSPLHAPLRQESERHDMPVPVHLSFKCHSEEEFNDVAERLSAHDDFWLAQACTSDYGVFTYWRHPDCDLYIKPRMNQRDAR